MTMLESKLPYDRMYDKFVEDVSKYPILSKEEQYNLAVKHYDENDLEAVNQLVLSNLRFVIKIASGYRSYGFPIMELIQEGYIGLIRGIQNFNPYKGYSLTTFSIWYIKAMIYEYITKSWSLVKIGNGRHQKHLFQQITTARRKLNMHDTLSDKDISKLAYFFSTKKENIVESEIRTNWRDLSLHDRSSNDSDKPPYIDYIRDESPNQEIKVSAVQSNSLVKLSMDCLDDKEKMIIKKRYLLIEPETLQVIGDELGLSKERVRQIEKIALRKMRNNYTCDNYVTTV